MPTYEYDCAACGHRFEENQKITADSLTDCPACGEPKLRRLISATAFHLKGSGWYKTDYGSSGSTGDSSSNSKKSGAAKASESTASESSASGSSSGGTAGADSSSSKKSETSAKSAS